MSKQVEKTKNCPSCGGKLEYSASHQNLFCAYCHGIVEIDKIKQQKFHDLSSAHDTIKEDKEFAKNNSVFNCENCGSQIVLSSSEFSKSCPYCGSYNIKKTRKNPGIAPDNIIPFSIEKEDAATRYKLAMKKKFFAPNEFKKKPPIDKIYGIYVPTLCFNANSETRYHGDIREQHTHIDAQGFRQTSYTYRPISGNIACSHKNVLVESSSYMNQLEFESIGKFDYRNLFLYNDDFIRGYYIEYHTTPLNICHDVAKNIMKSEISSSIRSRYFGKDVVHLSLNTKYSEENFAYYLLPTYKCEYTYKDKKYNAYINGQTGKVGGFAPKSSIKITFFVLALLLIFGGFTALFLYLFYSV